MYGLPPELRTLADAQHNLLTRAQFLDAGWTDDVVRRRVNAGLIGVIHEGVYVMGGGRLSWDQRVLAACLANDGVATHRTAATLHRLDGFRPDLVEVTVAHETELVAPGAIVHRTRRLPESDIEYIRGIPTVRIERVLCEIGKVAPEVLVEAALECALRRQATTETKIRDYLRSQGKGLHGVRRLRHVLAARPTGRPAASIAEVKVARLLREMGAPRFVRQHLVELPSGRLITLDFAWPERKVGVGWESYDFHSGRRAYEDGLDKHNELDELGWRMKYYGGGMLERSAARVARQIMRLLDETDPARAAA